MPISDYRPNLDSGRQGFIYVLSNKLMPGLYKIGATRKHPIQRARELGAGTGVPTPFVLEYYRDYIDAFLAETLIHERFEERRVDDAREFFSVPLDEVIDYIERLSSLSEYKTQLESYGLVGGATQQQKKVKPVPTPWADLFATFPDDGSPRELTKEEQAKCAALRATL